MTEAKKADILNLLDELGVSETVCTFDEDVVADSGRDASRQDFEESTDEGD